MITIKNSQRTYPIDTDRVRQETEQMLDYLRYQDFDLGIWFTTNRTIKKYNAQYREKNKATDILSFPFYPELTPGQKIIAHTPDEKNLGDLILSPEYIAKTSHKWDRDFETHLTALLAHGIAHLLGHDHIEDHDFATMQKLENKLIAAAGE